MMKTMGAIATLQAIYAFLRRGPVMTIHCWTNQKITVKSRLSGDINGLIHHCNLLDFWSHLQNNHSMSSYIESVNGKRIWGYQHNFIHSYIFLYKCWYLYLCIDIFVMIRSVISNCCIILFHVTIHAIVKWRMNEFGFKSYLHDTNKILSTPF